MKTFVLFLMSLVLVACGRVTSLAFEAAPFRAAFKKPDAPYVKLRFTVGAKRGTAPCRLWQVVVSSEDGVEFIKKVRLESGDEVETDVPGGDEDGDFGSVTLTSKTRNQRDGVVVKIAKHVSGRVTGTLSTCEGELIDNLDLDLTPILAGTVTARESSWGKVSLRARFRGEMK